jgi:cytochrome c-type biogenesis protein CcmH
MKPLVFALCLLAAPAFAVQPDEMLKDPAQESRARALSRELRCLVCRNENIDDSDAQLARDLRLLLRERITAGDSDTQAMAFITARYGEFVLLNPPATGANLILWLAGPGALIAGGALALFVMRRRSNSAEALGLSAEEQARLHDILKD